MSVLFHSCLYRRLAAERLILMKAYDIVKKIEIEVTYDSLIQLMKDGRQVDFVLPEPVTDADGYLTWDVEFWSAIDNRKFVRTYALNGKTLRDFSHYNIYDMVTDFNPNKAKEIRIS